MKTFDWKDKYVRGDGVDVTASAVYISLLGTKTGDGTRENPVFFSERGMKANEAFVFGGGVFNVYIGGSGHYAYYIIGQGINNTKFDELALINTSYAYTISNATVKFPSTYIQPSSIFYNCLILDLRVGATIYYSILRNVILNAGLRTQCTYVDSTLSVFSDKGLFSNCEIDVTQTTINNYINYYLAFNKCRFLIGSETVATELAGGDSGELKQNFIDRCTAQAITVPEVDGLQVGRWVFSDNSIVGEYYTLENSEIDLFAKYKNIYFGHTTHTVQNIPIVSVSNVANSFSPSNPQSNISVSNDSIETSISATSGDSAYISSKIIYLGGSKKLSNLNINENFPDGNGVSVNSVKAIQALTENIEANVNYLVRSANDAGAVISYNGVEYRSSVIDRNNVFKGVSGVTNYTTVSGNPDIYVVLSTPMYKSVQLRVVNEIPAGQITSGNLQTGYWYIVIPEDLNNPVGEVNYKGTLYPPFSSFLTTDTSSFDIPTPGVHLRRCWREEYTQASETTDATFWSGRQKPKWVDILPEDLRCLHKDDKLNEKEMKSDGDGNYIASGHIDFYNEINGVNGIQSPGYPVIGTFIQLRIVITTLNAM